MTNTNPMMIVMALIMLISLVFAFQGFSMHTKAEAKESKFHELQTNYFKLDKETRDSAETNSELNAQLGSIMNYPSELLRLKLVGIGKILIGIYILLLGILIALVTMVFKLGKMIKQR